MSMIPTSIITLVSTILWLGLASDLILWQPKDLRGKLSFCLSFRFSCRKSLSNFVVAVISILLSLSRFTLFISHDPQNWSLSATFEPQTEQNLIWTIFILNIPRVNLPLILPAETSPSWQQCVYPNGQWFFYKKIQNFTVALKRPFVFYSEMENFVNCTQTAIHIFETKYRILKVVPKRPFVFSARKYEI